MTGGEIERVDPSKLQSNFNRFLEKVPIATNVKLTLRLHFALAFRNQPEVDSVLTRDLGNVTSDTELTFDFRVREDVEFFEMTSDTLFPIQLQIDFVNQ